MRELFDARLREGDTPLAHAELCAAAETADVLVPTVTDRIDAEVIAAAGDRLQREIQRVHANRERDNVPADDPPSLVCAQQQSVCVLCDTLANFIGTEQGDDVRMK